MCDPFFRTVMHTLCGPPVTAPGRWGPGRAVLAHLCGGDSFSLRSGERAGTGSGRTLGLS